MEKRGEEEEGFFFFFWGGVYWLAEMEKNSAKFNDIINSR